MKTKFDYRDRLLNERAIKKRQNEKVRDILLLFLAAYSVSGEAFDFDYTRIVSAFLLLYLIRTYNQRNNELDKPLLFYDAQRKLRQSAHDNNMPDLTRCLEVLGISVINKPGPETGRTALHFAVSGDAYQAIQCLLSLGAEIDFQDHEGNTPVHTALIKLQNPTQKNYGTLFALLGYVRKNKTKVGNEALSHLKFDASLENDAKETIQDLLKKVPNHERAFMDYYETTNELVNFLIENSPKPFHVITQ